MGTRLGSKLEIGDRVKNVIFYYINTIVVMAGYQQGYVNRLREQYGISGSHARSQHNTGIVLAQSTWGLEFSHPIVPAIKVVGPILPEPARPLPAVRFIYNNLGPMSQQPSVDLQAYSIEFTGFRGVRSKCW